MPRPVKFFYDLLSTHSRALYMFFEATKIPYDPIPVCTTKGEHLADHHKENLGRFQQVPTIIDDGFKLSNGVTILKYLIREKLIPEHWYPRDHKTRARIDEYLEWQHDTTSKVFNAFVQQKYLADAARQEEGKDSNRVEQYRQQVNQNLNQLERDWIVPGRFIVGDRITIADILAACEVEQPKIVGLDPFAGRPQLASWVEKVRYTMSPYYQEAHRDFYKFTEKVAMKN
ncbi:glutathione S-transferase theta-1-like [Uranotaenia lowii]|uniref:glutathione S-transferase theta-1-like n=1 Tax=Uranotaenia lowii TaxID=190385 RepID=UPI00247AF434|nr:glutathione S-transferase theta-1-like [Uranotaenia lowii]